MALRLGWIGRTATAACIHPVDRATPPAPSAPGWECAYGLCLGRVAARRIIFRRVSEVELDEEKQGSGGTLLDAKSLQLTETLNFRYTRLNETATPQGHLWRFRCLEQRLHFLLDQPLQIVQHLVHLLLGNEELSPAGAENGEEILICPMCYILGSALLNLPR